MKLLLDTHLLVWAAIESARLPKAARRIMDDESNDLVFSTASLWEIVLKRGLGREDFQPNARLLRRNLMDNGYTELPVIGNHVLAVETLPRIHKDPFDRMLIAQATVEGITLLTADAVVAQYPGPIRKL